MASRESAGRSAPWIRRPPVRRLEEAARRGDLALAATEAARVRARSGRSLRTVLEQFTYSQVTA